MIKPPEEFKNNTIEKVSDGRSKDTSYWRILIL